MVEKILSNETLLINDIVIPYVNNTIEWTNELPESKVNVGNLGGGQRQTYLSVDASTFIGTFKFEVFNTEENRRIVEDFKARSNNGEGFTIKYGTKAIEDAVLTSKIESSSGAESTIAIEFQY